MWKPVRREARGRSVSDYCTMDIELVARVLAMGEPNLGLNIVGLRQSQSYFPWYFSLVHTRAFLCARGIVDAIVKD